MGRSELQVASRAVMEERGGDALEEVPASRVADSLSLLRDMTRRNLGSVVSKTQKCNEMSIVPMPGTFHGL